MRIDITGEAGVREVVGNLRDADADLQSRMMAQAREDLGDTWTQLLNEQIASNQDARILVAGATSLVGATGFLVLAAQSSVPLSGGLVPSDSWYADEFGARTRRATIDTHSRKGKPYRVTKMLNRGLPSRQRFGRVVFRAASEMGTALVGSWVNAMTTLYRDAVGDENRG